LTPTSTHTPTLTPTSTPTLTPTPIFVLVQSSEGARIRSLPGGRTSGFIANNSIVIMVPDSQKVEDGVEWVEVIIQDGTRGWILASLVDPVTPTPTP
jgi:hypothetical protein